VLVKLFLITNLYPKQEDLYRNAFIHRRVVEYQKRGQEVEILVTSAGERRSYLFEGVTVHEGSKEALTSYLNEQTPDKLLIHFLTPSIMDIFEGLEKKPPLLIWVHGFEALGWYRRCFELGSMGLIKFAAYIPYNMRQMWRMHRFVKKYKNESVQFIFVSNWMKTIMETDAKVKVEHSQIIPNVVETEKFPWKQKDGSLRSKILSIRPYHSRKYANDITVATILELSKRPIFSELEFTLYGKGKLFKTLTDPLRGFENVKLHETFLNQEEIAKAHSENGIFLCPTRQDAQGVSMCEAMSSGLVVISSDNTAIPEYVHDGVHGFTAKTVLEMADRIEQLYLEPDTFEKLSLQGSNWISEKCCADVVITEEMNLIRA
jgi:glycosyltransferase involved in cell wall biosynthesis